MRAGPALLLVLSVSAAQAAGQYTDTPTSKWFQDLRAPGFGGGVVSCCDQADCHAVASDYRDGGVWWAQSRATGTWVEIKPFQITRDGQGNVVYSILSQAVLCEGSPMDVYVDGQLTEHDQPRIYCFSPPPLGF